MDNSNNDKLPDEDNNSVVSESIPDEQMHLFVYGNILIKDPDSGDILVNKSF